MVFEDARLDVLDTHTKTLVLYACLHQQQCTGDFATIGHSAKHQKSDTYENHYYHDGGLRFLSGLNSLGGKGAKRANSK